MRSHISTSRFITESPLRLESIKTGFFKLQSISGKRLAHVSQRRLARLKWVLYCQRRAGGGLKCHLMSSGLSVTSLCFSGFSALVMLDWLFDYNHQSIIRTVKLYSATITLQIHCEEPILNIHDAISCTVPEFKF